MTVSDPEGIEWGTYLEEHRHSRAKGENIKLAELLQEILLHPIWHGAVECKQRNDAWQKITQPSQNKGNGQVPLVVVGILRIPANPRHTHAQRQRERGYHNTNIESRKTTNNNQHTHTHNESIYVHAHTCTQKGIQIVIRGGRTGARTNAQNKTLTL